MYDMCPYEYPAYEFIFVRKNSTSPIDTAVKVDPHCFR